MTWKHSRLGERLTDCCIIQTPLGLHNLARDGGWTAQLGCLGSINTGRSPNLLLHWHPYKLLHRGVEGTHLLPAYMQVFEKGIHLQRKPRCDASSVGKHRTRREKKTAFRRRPEMVSIYKRETVREYCSRWPFSPYDSTQGHSRKRRGPRRVPLANHHKRHTRLPGRSKH